MERSQPNGLLGNPNNPTEAGRYMYGHGFGLLFLASVYGEEEDEKRRKELEEAARPGRSSSRGKAQTDQRRLGLRVGARGRRTSTRAR